MKITIFKNIFEDQKLKAKKINYNSKKFKKGLKKLHKAQKECLDRKNIDWEKMSKTFITI